MQGAWGYVQGGMGALSDAITSSATAHGASIFTEKVSDLPPHTPLTLTICKDLSVEQNVKFESFLILLMQKMRLWNQGAKFMEPVNG